jgi:DNA-binding HxlR family transcriptional regulator
MNGFVKRAVHYTTLVTVAYELTPDGQSIRCALKSILQWNLEYRRDTISTKTKRGQNEGTNNQPFRFYLSCKPSRPR